MRLLVASRHFYTRPPFASTKTVRPFLPIAASQAYSSPAGQRQLTPELAKEVDDKYNRLDLSFRNAQEAFKSKTNYELLRAVIVLRLCAVKILVQNNQFILAALRRVLGKRLFKKVLKSTFYGHFVAGETADEIAVTMAKLRRYGVKSILDYSVERDLPHEEVEKKVVKQGESKAEIAPAAIIESGVVSSEVSEETKERYSVHPEFADRRVNLFGARSYFYESEHQCDKNADVFKETIDVVANATGGEGFAAIKVTALGRPALLLRLSESIAQTHNFFKALTGCSVGGLQLMCISKEDFIQKLKDFGVRADQEQIRAWFETVDFDHDGFVDFHGWDMLLDDNKKLGELFQVLNIKTGKLEPLIQNLRKQEEEEFANMLRRTVEVTEYGISKGIRVMVDAEQTYFQPAISRIAVAMMRKYNKERGNVFNTYQAYLRNTLNDIECDMQVAEREGWHFGAKLVRGAYIQQERERAAAIGYEDPINDTYEETSRNYERCLTRIADELASRGHGKVSVMIASHNEDTVRFAINLMRERGIAPSERIMCFAQLYAMCDQVSFTLGQAGYSVYKYLPFGPVEDVLPYLSRRALENGSILSKASEERKMLWAELKRRLTSLHFSTNS